MSIKVRPSAKGPRYQVNYAIIEGGRRVWRSAGTFATKDEARKAERRALSELDQGKRPANRSLTVGEYLTGRWLPLYRPDKEASKLLRAGHVRNHLVPALGGLRLAKLGNYEIDRFIRDKLDAGLKPWTVKGIVSTLQVALSQAVKWDLIPRSPFDRVTPLEVTATAVDVWSEDEAATFFAHDPAHEDWPLWVLLYTCELRIGEALALRWGDIDLDRGVVKIERGLTKTTGDRFAEGSPKTRKSRRTVTMPPELVAALRAHRDNQDGRRRALGTGWAGHVPGWVFDNGFGVRLHQETARGRFTAAQQAAGVRRMTFHQLRHCGASHELEAGANPRTLADRLGHESPALTLGLYAHSRVEQQRTASEAVARRVLRRRTG